MNHGSHKILVGDVRARLADLPEQSVHCVCTSPPYWGLRQYIDDGADEKHHELGLEPTPEQHIENMVEVFRGVRRVLRDDATCWMNYGDTIMDGGDLGMIPHRVALALQADGWLVRSAIVWAKGVSFCPTYHGSVMPESVNGWRWERCRVKVAPRPPHGNHNPHRNDGGSNGPEGGVWSMPHAEWSDCPGCPKCNANGGLVLRKGSWRPTSGYEMVFMLAKQGGYFCDAEAVRERLQTDPAKLKARVEAGHQDKLEPSRVDNTWKNAYEPTGRNPRNVWTINPAPFPDAHFATYPPALVTPMVKVATSQKGVCPECQAPWARVVETNYTDANRGMVGNQHKQVTDDLVRHSGRGSDVRMNLESTTLGWRPTCGCTAYDMPNAQRREPNHPDPGYNLDGTRRAIPATVLDPFSGSGTTGMVACSLGRNYIGIELNPEYAKMSEARIGKALRPNTYRDPNKETEAPLFNGSP